MRPPPHLFLNPATLDKVAALVIYSSVTKCKHIFVWPESHYDS